MQADILENLKNANLEQAIQLLKEYIQKYPKEAEMHFYYAWYLMTFTKEFDTAKTHYEIGLGIKPDDSFANNNYGYLLEKRYLKYEEAKSYYEKAINIDPQNAEAHCNLAYLLETRSQDFDEAEIHYKATLTIDPEHEEAAKLYKAFLERHEKRIAKQNFDHAEKIGMKIFISYSWANAGEAESIDRFLNIYKLDVKRDVRELKPLDSVTEFMDSIGESDHAILLISDSYLTSKACMYEMLKLLGHPEFAKKVVPILCGDVKLSKGTDRITYFKFWEEEIQKLESDIRSKLTSLTFISSLIYELEHATTVRNRLNELFNFLTGHIYFSFDELSMTYFNKLRTHLGLPAINTRHLPVPQYFEEENISRISFEIFPGNDHLFQIYRLILYTYMHPDLEMEELLGILESVVDNLALYFSERLENTCYASIHASKRVPVEIGGLVSYSGRSTFSIIRDRTSANALNKKDEKYIYNYINNLETAISSGYPNTYYFLSNDVKELSQYKDTLLDGEHIDELMIPFSSIMILPLFLKITENGRATEGFLCIESLKKNAFNGHDLKIAQEIAHQLFFPFQRFKGLEKNSMR